MDFSEPINILVNIANNLVPIQQLIAGTAYLIGLAFAFKAIYSLKAYGEARSMMSSNSSIKEPIFYLMIAAMLIFLPTAVKMMLGTVFGYNQILAYQPVTGETVFGTDAAVAKPVILLVQTIGLYAFVRGWVLIARASGQGGGHQPGTTGKGLVHVFGGILAMNIVGTMQIIHNTLYGVG